MHQSTEQNTGTQVKKVNVYVYKTIRSQGRSRTFLNLRLRGVGAERIFSAPQNCD
jgi:hypothetical protein